MRSPRQSPIGIVILAGLVTGVVVASTRHDAEGATKARRPVVALFDVEPSGAFLDSGGVGRLTALMSARLRSRFDVVVMSAMGPGKGIGSGDDDPSSCRETDCRVGLARKVKASRMMIGQVIELGGAGCQVKLELIDVKQGTPEAGGSATGKCDEESLLESCERAVRVLLGEGEQASSFVTGGSTAGPVASPKIGAMAEASGFLVIRTPVAGAVIRVDGREVGRSPVQLELEPGTYLVEADMGPRFHTARRVVELTSGGARIELAPREAFGSLTVRSEPSGAEVRLDGRVVGRTPLIDFECAGGVRAMEVALADHLTVSESVEVIDGRSVERRVVLAPSKGTLMVESTPPGALVHLDGRDTGQRTPCTLGGLAVGRQKLALNLEGYAPDSFEIELDGRGATRVHRELLARQGLMLVLIEDPKGGSLECPIMLDGNLVGLAPWKGTVQARRHDITVECIEGRASQVVEVPADDRVRVVLVVGDGVGQGRVAAPDATPRESVPKEMTERQPASVAVPEPGPIPIPEPDAIPAPKPWYRKWWPWAILGGAVLAGTGLALGLTLGQDDAGVKGTGRIDWR